MKFSTVEKFALGLPEVTREPHFHLDSFRVKGRIFVTADTKAGFIRVFVPDEVREPALAKYPAFLTKLHWGKKVVGLQITLSAADPGVVKELVQAAWFSKAPVTLARRLKQPGLANAITDAQVVWHRTTPLPGMADAAVSSAAGGKPRTRKGRKKGVRFLFALSYRR